MATDSNHLLKQIRDIVRKHHNDPSFYTTLCDLICTLDQHLSNGGSKPKDWEIESTID